MQNKSHFIPLPRLRHRVIVLNPRTKITETLYPPANYNHNEYGIEQTCPHCGKDSFHAKYNGHKTVSVGVYTVQATFKTCTGCGHHYFTVSTFDIQKYWSK